MVHQNASCVCYNGRIGRYSKACNFTFVSIYVNGTKHMSSLTLYAEPYQFLDPS